VFSYVEPTDDYDDNNSNNNNINYNNNNNFKWILSSLFFMAAKAAARKIWKIRAWTGESNPDFFDAGAVLHQLSYQAN